MKLPRLYYTLPELAEKWGKSENDLLHLAAAGELELSAIHESTGYCVESLPHERKTSGYVQLESDSARRFLEFGFKRYHVVMTVRWCGSRIRFLSPGSLPSDPEYIFKERPVVIFETSDLLILPDEVARAEAKFSDLAGRNAAAVEAVDQAHEETVGQVGREHACGGTDIAQLFNAYVRRHKPYTQKQVVKILRDNNILPESLGRSDRKPLQAYKDDIIRIAKAHKE